MTSHNPQHDPGAAALIEELLKQAQENPAPPPPGEIPRDVLTGIPHMTDGAWVITFRPKLNTDGRFGIETSLEYSGPPEGKRPLTLDEFLNLRRAFNDLTKQNFDRTIYFTLQQALKDTDND
jgi:hypothetical protein